MEFVCEDESPINSLVEAFLDKKKDLPSLQNFSRKLVIHADAGSLHLISVAPHKFLPFVMFKFSQDWSGSLAPGLCATQTVDMMEGHFVKCFQNDL